MRLAFEKYDVSAIENATGSVWHKLTNKLQEQSQTLVSRLRDCTGEFESCVVDETHANLNRSPSM